MRKPFRIGSGAGFSGDRLEPACVLAEQGDIDFLALECLGERTIALAQLRKRKNAALGYDPLLERRMDLLLPLLKSHGVRLISNFGAANPLAAADAIIAIARRHNLAIRIAVITGDDVAAGKPDPAVYRLAAEHLNLGSSQILVLEDAPSGSMRCVEPPGLV